jgi:hypothetical protein
MQQVGGASLIVFVDLNHCGKILIHQIQHLCMQLFQLMDQLQDLWIGRICCGHRKTASPLSACQIANRVESYRHGLALPSHD